MPDQWTFLWVFPSNYWRGGEWQEATLCLPHRRLLGVPRSVVTNLRPRLFPGYSLAPLEVRLAPISSLSLCPFYCTSTLRQDVAVMEQNKSRDLWLNCLIKMIDGLDISITIMTIALLQLIRANCGWFACGAIPDPCYAVMCYVLCCPCQCPLPDPLGPSMPTSYTIACPQKVFTMCGCALLMAPFDMVLKCGAVVV